MLPSKHEIDVVASKPGPKLEGVSSRLKRALIHPNKGSYIEGIRFSPDGKRIVAGDYPGGIVQLWDVETGKQLIKIETGHEFRGSEEYFFLTPDWKALFVAREKRKGSQIEKVGKKGTRWEFDGDIRVWDFHTGKLKATLKHDPPRGIQWMKLSPDGLTIVTGEHLSGETEGAPKETCSIWDVRTGKHQSFPEDLRLACLSPDGKTVALAALDTKSRFTTAIKLIDVATAKEKLSIPVTEKFAMAYAMTFTPDGKSVVGHSKVFPGRSDFQTWQSYLKLWDAESGTELASFPGEQKNSAFSTPVFSPDGKGFACVDSNGDVGMLFLFDLASRKLVKSIVLSDKRTETGRELVRSPVYSPDGRWLAVLTQMFPKYGREPHIEDVAQPRIHLIDAGKGVICETLVLPQCVAASICFSPDGRTLASGGHGKVLLWDVSDYSPAR
ncbi:MAG: WD40 repeat domain-containing protein [Planctomycetes bacterium]|nr:WD40 repeat domain-containing protein [Planctomycetota bacterium]